MRFLRRLMLFAVIAGIATALMRRLRDGECGPACECSQGSQLCNCGHNTCLSPAEA